MKVENFAIAYNEYKIIVAEMKTGGEIFPAKGISVETFDSLEEMESFISSNGLMREVVSE